MGKVIVAHKEIKVFKAKTAQEDKGLRASKVTKAIKVFKEPRAVVHKVMLEEPLITAI